MLVRIAALLTLIMPTSGQSSGQAPPFEDLAHRAEVARDAKRLDDALTLYKRALKLKPGWEDGWWNAGSIAYDSNHYKECTSDFRRLAELKPQDAPAWTHRAAVGLLLTWPFAWVALILLGKSLL